MFSSDVVNGGGQDDHSYKATTTTGEHTVDNTHAGYTHWDLLPASHSNTKAEYFFNLK